MSVRRALSVLAVVASLGAAEVASAAEIRPGWVATKVCEGITGGTTLTVLPDGRLLIGEQTGALRMVKNGALLPAPALVLPVDSTWERGLLGVALDPKFTTAPHVYIHWTVEKPEVRFRISRFTLVGDALEPASEKILFEGDDQGLIRAGTPAGHQGGGIAFAPDGMLLVSVGEMTTQLPAQNLDSLLGKLLRLRPDGTIPEDNAFHAKATGKYRAIHAIGLRNPWTIAVQPGTGRVFINDIGASAYEEVNELVAGANYGWPQAEGRTEVAKFKDPELDYPHSAGQSLGGGCFYSPAKGAPHAWPAEYHGRYVVMDFMAGWLGLFDKTKQPNLELVARALAKPVAVATSLEGDLLVLERNTWLKDADFKPGQGWLTRLRHTGESTAAPPAAAAGAFPPLWSAGNFEKGAVPYSLRAEPWMPGVEAQRLVSVPAGGKLTARERGQSFAFPEGTRLIEHRSSRGKRVLTTVIITGPPAQHRAAAYKWRTDGREADLVTEPAVQTVDGRSWALPAPTGDMVLPPPVPGYEFALKPVNLAEGSLADLVVGEAPEAHLVPLTATKSPAEARVRSCLDVNCSACHVPGGIGRGAYDARFTTPLEKQNLVNGPLVSGDLGVAGAKAVVPGAPDKSMLLIRLRKPPGDSMRMPPGCQEKAPPPVVTALEQWIRGLK